MVVACTVHGAPGSAAHFVSAPGGPRWLLQLRPEFEVGMNVNEFKYKFGTQGILQMVGIVMWVGGAWAADLHCVSERS